MPFLDNEPTSYKRLYYVWSCSIQARLDIGLKCWAHPQWCFPVWISILLDVGVIQVRRTWPISFSVMFVKDISLHTLCQRDTLYRNAENFCGLLECDVCCHCHHDVKMTAFNLRVHILGGLRYNKSYLPDFMLYRTRTIGEFVIPIITACAYWNHKQQYVVGVCYPCCNNCTQRNCCAMNSLMKPVVKIAETINSCVYGRE